ncbi:MAG: flagellar basal-body rod protein FlgF [Pelosinus sp.]|nr:flagellar basal-body rod protein FlgF [Pelosinus sp.]
MIKGIYSATSGMLAEATRTDTIANNLANVNTPGYKKDIVVTKDFASTLIERINDGKDTPVIGSMGVGVIVDEIKPVTGQGAIYQSGNPLDVAIEGKGYFVVQTPNGTRYTRNGNFTQNSRGELVTQDGYQVLGNNNNPIRLKGSNVTITNQGNVVANNVTVNKLQYVQFVNEKQLDKEGSSLYFAPPGAPMEQATGRLRQTYLEMSNVNVVTEMVNLISNYRAYEVNAKTIQAHDQLLQRAVNDVGKV